MTSQPPDLFRSVSWAADKVLKHKGTYDIVLVQTLDTHGKRQGAEFACQAPDGVPDDAILEALAVELQDDFKTANITEFAICYAVSRCQELRNTETGEVLETKRTQGVIIEHFGPGGSQRGFREVISLCGSRPVLGSPELLGDATDSIYARILQDKSEVAMAAE